MITVGIDWAEDHHDVTVMDDQGQLLARQRIPEGLDGVTRLHALLADHATTPDQVLVGIETDRGLLVGALLAAGYQVFAINPKAVDRDRERHAQAGAKSDGADAKVLPRPGPHRPAQPPPCGRRQRPGRGGQDPGQSPPQPDLDPPAAM